MGELGTLRRRWPWIAGAVVVVLALAATGIYLWWTAVPKASEAELAAALAWAGPAEGRVAIAQPRRALRWSLRHRQVTALAVLAAPQARAGVGRLQPLLRSLVAKARGPLVVWWRGGDVAAAARVSPGVARALALLAARGSLPYTADGELCRVATAADLLVGGATVADAPSAGRARAVLAELGGRRWSVDAERSRLIAAAGAFVAVPERGTLSRVETADAAPLARALGLAIAGAGAPARAIFAADRGWGAELAGVELPGFLRGPVAGGAGAIAWQGLLGEVLIHEEGGRVLIATDREIMAALATPVSADEGDVRWDDLAWLADDLAERIGALPLLDREARALREAARGVRGPGGARWRLTPAAGRVLLEW